MLSKKTVKTLWILPVTLFAGTFAAADTQDEIAELKARLSSLEQQVAAAEQKAVIAEKKASTRKDLSERIHISGLVETEGVYTDSAEYSSEPHSDLVLATVEIGVDAEIAENVEANLVFLYEDDGDEEFDVDVAVITFSDISGSGINLVFGQGYVPFGTFATNMVNDTLVLELAETRESIAMVNYENGAFSFSGYVFNGDVDNRDTVENYGASINFGNSKAAIGIDYLSNIADSDTITDIIDEGTFFSTTGELDATPDAYILRGMLAIGPVNLFTEYLRADSFDAEDWGMPLGKEFEPEVWHIEAATDIQDWTLAVAYQETDKVATLFPEERISLGASTDLSENVSLTIEYWRDKDYSTSDGGTDDNAESITARVAVIF